MTKKILIGAIGGLFLLTLSGRVVALTPQAATSEAKQTPSIAAARCKNIETKISTKVTRFDQNKEKHVTVYQNTKERIEKFIAKMKEKGYDTSQLETDLKTFDTKIKEFSASYSVYVQKLQQTQAYTCGHSEGQFKTQLQDTRDQLKLVHQKAVELRSYYQNTLRSDIQALKQQNLN